MSSNRREKVFLKISFFITLLSIIFVVFVLTNHLSKLSIKNITAEKPQKVKITRVIDGDTIVTENNGIDAPEKSQHNPEKCLSDRATQKAKDLLEGQYVDLEKDVSDTDKYGRLLRYIWLNNQLINNTLVEEGYAKASFYNPDIKYKLSLESSEIIAQQRKLGVWGNVCSD